MPVSSSAQASAASAVPVLEPMGKHTGKPSMPMGRPFTLVGSRHRAHLHLLSRTVSKSHAVFLNDGGSLIVRDTASREHVYVNGEIVKEAEIVDGDLIRIGSFTFKLSDPSAKSGHVEPRRALAGMIEPEDGSFPTLFEGRTILIGRRPTCDIVLSHPSVSNVHAIVYEVGGQYILRDLGSRTGTFINEEQIQHQPLKFGDDIHIGESHFRFAEARTSGDLDELEHLVGTSKLGDESAALARADAARAGASIEPLELAPAEAPNAFEPVPEPYEPVPEPLAPIEHEPAEPPPMLVSADLHQERAAGPGAEGHEDEDAFELDLDATVARSMLLGGPAAIPLAVTAAESLASGHDFGLDFEPEHAHHERTAPEAALPVAHEEHASVAHPEVAETIPESPVAAEEPAPAESHDVHSDVETPAGMDALHATAAKSPELTDEDMESIFGAAPTETTVTAHETDVASVENELAAPVDFELAPAEIPAAETIEPELRAEAPSLDDLVDFDWAPEPVDALAEAPAAQSVEGAEAAAEHENAFTPVPETPVDEFSAEIEFEAETLEPPPVEAATDASQPDDSSLDDLDMDIDWGRAPSELLAESPAEEPAPATQAALEYETPAAAASEPEIESGNVSAESDVAGQGEQTLPFEEIETTSELPSSSLDDLGLEFDWEEPAVGELASGDSVEEPSAVATEAASVLEIPATPAAEASGESAIAFEAENVESSITDSLLAETSELYAAPIDDFGPDMGLPSTDGAAESPAEAAAPISEGAAEADILAAPQEAVVEAEAPDRSRDIESEFSDSAQEKAALLADLTSNAGAEEFPDEAVGGLAPEHELSAQPQSEAIGFTSSESENGDIHSAIADSILAESASAPGGDFGLDFETTVAGTQDSSRQFETELTASILAESNESPGTPAMPADDFGIEFENESPESLPVAESVAEALPASSELEIVESPEQLSREQPDQLTVHQDSVATTEVLPVSEPTLDSVHDLEQQLGEAPKDEFAKADELSDTGFGRAVADFSGSALGSLVEEGSSPTIAEAPAALSSPHEEQSAETTEVLAVAEPNFESVHDLENQLGEAPSDEFAGVEELSDTGFGRAVAEFSGSALGSLVEESASPAPAEAPVDKSVPAYEESADAEPAPTPQAEIAVTAHESAIEFAGDLEPLVPLVAEETAVPLEMFEPESSLVEVAPNIEQSAGHVDPIVAPIEETVASATGDEVVDSALAFLEHAGVEPDPHAMDLEFGPINFEEIGSDELPRSIADRAVGAGAAGSPALDLPDRSFDDMTELGLDFEDAAAPQAEHQVTANEADAFVAGPIAPEQAAPGDDAGEALTMEHLAFEPLSEEAAPSEPEFDLFDEAPPEAEATEGFGAIGDAQMSSNAQPPDLAATAPEDLLAWDAPAEAAPPIDEISATAADGIAADLSEPIAPAQISAPAELMEPEFAAPAPDEIPPAPIPVVRRPAGRTAPVESPMSEAPAPEVPPAASAPKIDPFFGMSRDFGSFLGGMPLPLAERPAPTFGDTPVSAVLKRDPLPSPVMEVITAPVAEVNEAESRPAARSETSPIMAPAAPTEVPAHDSVAPEFETPTPASKEPVGDMSDWTLDAVDDDREALTPLSDVLDAVRTAPLAPASVRPLAQAVAGASAASAVAKSSPAAKQAAVKQVVAAPKKDPAQPSPAAAGTSKQARSTPPPITRTPPPRPAARRPAGLVGGRDVPSLPSVDVFSQLPVNESAPAIPHIPRIPATPKSAAQQSALKPASRKPGDPTSAPKGTTPAIKPARRQPVIAEPLEVRAPDPIEEELEQPAAEPAPQQVRPENKKKKWRFPFLKMVLLGLAGGGGALTAWSQLPPRYNVTAFMNFDGLKDADAAGRSQFQREQVQALSSLELRKQGQAIFEGALHGPAGGGLLGSANADDAAAYESMVDSAGFDGDRMILQRPASRSAESDALSLRAALSALYQFDQTLSEKNGDIRSKREAAVQSLAQADQRLHSLQDRITESQRKQADFELATQKRAALTERTAQLEAAWNKASDAAHALQVEVAALSAAPVTQPAQTEDSGQFKRLADRVAMLKSLLAAIPTAAAGNSVSGAVAFESTLGDLQQEIAAGASLPGGNSDFSDYLARLSQAIPETRSADVELAGRQKAEAQTLADLQRALAEKIESHRREVLAVDPILSQTAQDLAVQKHRLGAANGAGLTADAGRIQTRIAELNAVAQSRSAEIASSIADNDNIRGARQAVADQLEKIRSLPAANDERIARQWTGLRDSAPKQETLAPGQAAVVEAISSKIGAVIAAHPLVSNDNAGQAIAALASEEVELSSQIDAHGAELAGAGTTATVGGNALARKRADLETAKDAQSKAMTDLNNAKAELASIDAMLAPLESARTEVAQMNADLIALNSERDDLKSQIARLPAVPVITAISPDSDETIHVIPLPNHRLAAIGLDALITCLIAIVLLIRSFQDRPHSPAAEEIYQAPWDHGAGTTAIA